MKRWTPQAIERLKRQSEQSRRGQPVDLDPDQPRPERGDLIITVGKPRAGRQSPNVAIVPIESESGQPLELRIRSPKGSRRPIIIIQE